ncbi:MAG: hypothetical protein KF891_15925 [Rhizobacter sp.]|nr:hypothetical protein [Rhizobacter sp.]
MQLDPYVSFAGFPFTLQREALLARRGPPLSEARNEVGLHALDYGDTVLRFQDCGRLEEITAQAPVVQLGSVAVPFASLQGFVTGHDPLAFWRARFLVSPALGLAFDPTEPAWVTALAKHCLPEWEAL